MIYSFFAKDLWPRALAAGQRSYEGVAVDGEEGIVQEAAINKMRSAAVAHRLGRHFDRWRKTMVEDASNSVPRRDASKAVIKAYLDRLWQHSEIAARKAYEYVDSSDRADIAEEAERRMQLSVASTGFGDAYQEWRRARSLN